MTTFEQHGIVPCAYAIPVPDRAKIVEKDRNAWAIVHAGCCLNADNQWEVEPMPSNRTDEFKARTRWPLPEAMARAVRYYRLPLL